MNGVDPGFGNPAWYFYVAGAYGIVALSLLGYAVFCLRIRGRALRSLKDEGFLADGENEKR